MNWTDVVRQVASRSGESQAATKRVLEALLDEVREAVVRGEAVQLPQIGRLSSSWSDPRLVRSVADGRKILLDGRFVPQFRASSVLREQLAARTPQHWRSPEHQQARRLAETLVGDLALYHADEVPKDLDCADAPTRVEERCAETFGPHWESVVATYTTRAQGDARRQPYLGMAARRRWAR